MATEETSKAENAANFFATLTIRQKTLGMVGVAAAVGLLAALILWSRQPDYGILYSSLDDKEGGAVVVALQQANIPYKFSERGNAIMIPSRLIQETRMRLATQGIPKGPANGYELMADQKFGISQFAEQVNYQRALEVEIGRTITSLAAVASARVHLAVPKQTGFLRDDQKPSASVAITLRSGHALDAEQIAGIVHLVSSSVPRLSPKQVSVVDQHGTLLNQVRDSDTGLQLDASQIKFRKTIEAGLIKRIEDILTPIVGSGNVRAQVSAELDFTQAEQTSESYKPNSDQSAIRSQQTAESTNRPSSPSGIPGPTSNQPPSLSAPITLPSNTAGTASQQGASNKNATTNYELDKTVKVTRQNTGDIKRLAVAVVVNYSGTKNDKGELVWAALPEAQMKQINDLAKEAVGFNSTRGDTIAVANTRFVVEEKEVAPEVPLWKDPENIELAKDVLKYLVVAIVALYLVFGVIKPLVRQIIKPAPPKKRKNDDAAAGDVQPAAAVLSYDDKLAEAKSLAKNDPKLVANVIKDWVGTN